MTTDTNGAVGAALDHLRQHRDRHREELDEFLRIESVSADPDRADDVRRAAEWITAELDRIGFEHVSLHETSGHPVVTGEWLHAGPERPTVLVGLQNDSFLDAVPEATLRLSAADSTPLTLRVVARTLARRLKNAAPAS